MTPLWMLLPAEYLFRAKGSVPKFSGWMAVYEKDTPQGDAEKVVNGHRKMNLATEVGCCQAFVKATYLRSRN